MIGKEFVNTTLRFIAVMAVALRVVADVPASKPSFRFSLDLAQYSLLNNALSDALRGAPAEIGLELRVRSRDREVEWEVTLASAAMVRACQAWISASALRQLQAIDLAQMTEDQRRELEAYQRLGAALDHALDHPLWPEREIRGILSRESGITLVTSDAGPVRLLGTCDPALTNGMAIIARGVVKKAGVLEAISLRPVPRGTVEVFTMSHCPFGNSALGTIMNQLESLPSDQRPTLRIRFIFYPYSRDGVNIDYRSLHGPVELTENLVQILIQRDHPEVLYPYLRHRLGNLKASWQEVAKEAGLASAMVDRLDERLRTNELSLLMDEYHYVAQLCGVMDGSPRFFWEGSEVNTLSAIPAFASLGSSEAPLGRCAD